MTSIETGFYGKLPSHGDFLTRRLQRSFVDPWDAWLQAVIAHSQAQLTSSWLDTYLVSPIWRFAISPGCCGDHAWCGIVMPSVDRVGRYFPLTIAAPLPDQCSLSYVVQQADHWFVQCEHLALDALDGAISLEEFDQKVALLSSPVISPIITEQHPQTPPYQITSPQTLDILLCDINQKLLNTYMNKHSFWWTKQGIADQTVLMLTESLPSHSQYLSMLSGGANQPSSPPLGASDVSDLL